MAMPGQLAEFQFTGIYRLGHGGLSAGTNSKSHNQTPSTSLA